MVDKTKVLGQVFTPQEIADLIAYWAIRDKSDLVLDPAAGTGVFIDAAVKRLKELGSTKPNKQVYGIELDRDIFTILKNKYNINIFNVDYFKCSDKLLPKFDAIIGNPPYIERQLLGNFETLRVMYPEVPSLADIYVYFIVHSLKFLKNGGRLSFIVSDSWLTVNFGKFLKDLLLSKYILKTIISFDRRVFNKLISSTIIFVEKPNDSNNRNNGKVTFVRVKKLTPTIFEEVKKIINGEPVQLNEVKLVQIPNSSLSSEKPWVAYAYGFKEYVKLEKHPLITRLHKIAKVSTGLFTLANSFYIIDKKKRKYFKIENKFLKKAIISAKKLTTPIIEGSKIDNYVLYCPNEKEELIGTNILKYIEWGEKQKVRIRGKDRYVIGYNNTPRIKAAGRNPWYNLTSEINKRCIKPIVFPRRIYGKYIVGWNKDNIVILDNFVGIEPKNKEWLFPLLAVLNSSITEYLVRIFGHLYGGGVCDLTPSLVKNIPVLDLSQISKSKLRELENAFKEYTRTLNRDIIDITLIKLLKFSSEDLEKIVRELDDIKEIQRKR